VLLYSHASLQGLNLSELLVFDPASVGSAILEADDPQPDSTRVTGQLLRVKDLLSSPIDALVQDSSAVRQILEEVNSQLPVALQIKLGPTGHLPFFRARVAQAHHRIETRRSQTSLKANIAERCRLVNEKKAVLDTKADTSVHTQRLLLLEKELEDLKKRIQEEKDLIASSKREAEVLTAQLKVDLAELSALSKQLVPGVDEEDKAVIAEANRVHLEAIASIASLTDKLVCVHFTL
jgi:predicted transcriptional regulator